MWEWVAFLGGSAAVLLWMSRAQPFPEIGARWAWWMLAFAGLLAISVTSPREMNPSLPPMLAVGFGGLGTVVGVHHASVRRTDDIVAPFASLWLAVGTISLLGSSWAEFNRSEQLFGFGLATLVVLLTVFLLWKGLIIGVQGITWSQAALRQLERGLIDGERGAIAMFEKSWNVDESWLDAMSHAALVRIHERRGEVKAAAKHADLLSRLGGEEAVDPAWISRVDSCLRGLRAPIRESE